MDSWEALKQILFRDSYADACGLEYFIRLTVQDAMGHLTAEVYDFCRLNPGVIPWSNNVYNRIKINNILNPITAFPSPLNSKVIRTISVTGYRNKSGSGILDKHSF